MKGGVGEDEKMRGGKGERGRGREDENAGNLDKYAGRPRIVTDWQQMDFSE